MQQQRSDQILTLSGEIDNRTLTSEDYDRFTRHMAAGVREIVFSDIARIDSAGVSLLIAAKRMSQDAPLTISGAPAALRDLLTLYQLQEWITLS